MNEMMDLDKEYSSLTHKYVFPSEKQKRLETEEDWKEQLMRMSSLIEEKRPTKWPYFRLAVT